MSSKHRWLWVVVAVALVATACLGGGGSDPDVPQEGTTTSEVPSTGLPSTFTSPVSTAGGGSAPGATIPGDLCDTKPKVHSYLVEIGLLDEKDLADLPVPIEFESDGYWSVGPLGSDGAFEVGESLSAGWLCDLDVSPEVAEALASYVDDPNGEITPDDISQIIAEGQTGGANQTSGGGVEVLSPEDLQQRSRDALAAAATAVLAGRDGESDRFMSDAQDYFSAYAEQVLTSSTDPTRLLDVAAAALLLGLDDLGGDIMSRVEELLMEELAEAASLFSKCTTNESLIRNYVRALERANVVYGASTATLEAWQEVQERRMLGESIPECEGGTWEAHRPIDGWDGEVVVRLETCGWKHWTGSMTSVGSAGGAGGTMTQFSETPLEFDLVDAKALPSFVLPWEWGRAGSSIIDIDPVVDVTITAEDARGSGTASMSGSAIFEMDGSAESATATFHFGPGQFDVTIVVDGMTFHRSQVINWGDWEMTAPIQKSEGECNPDG